jgi:DNA mismatch repair protein MutL
MTPDRKGHPRIQTLSPEIIERIAAGEVIERPASVVRELIANALDAGASDVRIETREGGLRLIRVSDNGCGIDPDDLELSTHPHTTSKVHALDDLERLTTLGFRGEALASIAAVAELTLASACDSDGIADAITLRGGVALARETLPRTRGVTVTVRDLFHVMPARRAALRSPRFEEASVVAVVRAYALAHPAIRFTLSGDGALLLQTPGTDLEGAIAAIFGADIARSLAPLAPEPSSDLLDVTISGVVATRPFHFPTREHIYLSVNGRPLANRALYAALEAGYRSAMRKGRHPLLIARVNVAPEWVDANIHPTKLEVLLRDEKVIGGTLRRLTYEALGRSATTIAMADKRSLTFTTSSTLPLRLTYPAMRRRRGLRQRQLRHDFGMRLDPPPWDVETPSAAAPDLTPLAQFDGALIIARSADDQLYLVDQHRAHERILYERLVARCQALPYSHAKDAAVGQLLLEPLLIELTPLQARILSARLNELSVLGLELQPFGGSAFLARALPYAPGAAQSAAGFVQALAQDAAEEGDDWLDHVCVSLACRSAIRRGQILNEDEQHALLNDLQATTAPAVCPHGSPLLIRHSRAALTRIFEW